MFNQIKKITYERITHVVFVVSVTTVPNYSGYCGIFLGESTTFTNDRVSCPECVRVLRLKIEDIQEEIDRSDIQKKPEPEKLTRAQLLNLPVED